jgi:AraC-like DNA-binding protein
MSERSLRAVDRRALGEPAPTAAAAERGRALEVVTDARAMRDRRIVELREAGWRIVEISRELGLSTAWVARVIERAGGVERERWLKARSELHLRRAVERSDEILQRFRAGERPPLIANELGLNQQAVWRIVRELGTDADRSARAWVLADHHRPRFSETELLDGLIAVALRLGWVPNAGEYDRAARELGLASSTTLNHRFDGWQGALVAAGLQAPRPRRWPLRWDAAECWRALESVSDRLGDPPRYRRYRELAIGRDDLPSAGVLRNRLGLWSQIAAELTRRTHGGVGGPAPVQRVAARPRVSLPSRAESGVAGRRAREFSDEQLLAGVRAVGERVGHVPGRGDYERLAKPLGLASHPTVCIRLGSWSGALRAAGYEPAARKRAYARKWDQQACWDALHSVADELGDWPTYRHYEQLAAGRDDLPSAAMLRQRLGPWSQIAAVLRERRGASAAQRLEASAA